MALFTGTFRNKVDSKGRISVPADFRATLPVIAGERRPPIYVWRSFRHNALEACDHQFMERLSAGSESLDMFSEAQDSLASAIFADAQRLIHDDPGRIVLPERMIEYANIDGEAVFVGRGPYFQIWAPDALEQHMEEARAKARDQKLTAPLAPSGDGS